MITILLLTILFFVGYLIYLIITGLKFYLSLGVKHLNPFIEESLDMPDYEPAVMGYLVNFQKIGKREVCSTLFHLISKDVIKLELKKGLVNDDEGEYILIKNDTDVPLNDYETMLVKYLFDKKDTITNKTLANKLNQNESRKQFYSKFLKAVQRESMAKGFFDEKAGKRKAKVYKIIDKVVTVMATVSSLLMSFSCEVLGESAEPEILVLVGAIFIYVVILWILKFSISFAYNITCHYNSLSKKGNEDYKRWLGVKRYFKKWSSFKEQPMMSVIIWEKYYSYAIGLKVSKKFFKQMKKMKIADNSIDIKLFETFNDIISCIGISAKSIKKIKLDQDGGAHIEY